MNRHAPAAQIPLQGDPGMTLSEMVRKTLIDLIIRGEFEEGFRLYPEQIAERFGVSITPVREALLQLSSEGFIDNIQRRGFRVMVPSADQIRDMWQVRQSLELLAGELLIARLETGEVAEAELDVLTELQDAQEKDAGRMDHVRKLELNGNLHGTIVALSGNTLLWSIHQGLRHRVIGALVQRGSDSWRDRVTGEAAEHRAIIEGLRARDVAAYDAAVRAHVSRSLRDALKDLETRKEPGSTGNIREEKT